MSKYEVIIAVSGEARYIVEAQNEDEAREKAKAGEGLYTGTSHDPAGDILGVMLIEKGIMLEQPQLPSGADPNSLRYIAGGGDWWCRLNDRWFWWDRVDVKWKASLHGPD